MLWKTGLHSHGTSSNKIKGTQLIKPHESVEACPAGVPGRDGRGTFDHSLESRAAEGALLVKVGAEGEQIAIVYAFA